MKRVSVLMIVCSLLLSACGTFEVSVETTPVGNSGIAVSRVTVEPKLSMDSTSEQIQRAMLESATKWKSIWMDGRVTEFALDGTNSSTVTHEQVWIDLTTDRFRVLTGPNTGTAEKYLTSDGGTILEMDVKSGQSQSRPMPDLGDVKQFVPTLQPGYAYPQPLWGQMGTPLSQLAFPSDFAQNEGTFKPTATESIAGRDALVVEWTYAQNSQPSWRMWLDTKTAVILKMQNFDKSGGGSVHSEVVVNQISFDDVFANALFGIPSSLPQFSDISGQNSAPVETGADVPSGRDGLGELYFFESPHQSNQVARLVSLPGRCAVGEAACPTLNVVALPFFLKSLPSISWSPDGRFAALAYLFEDQTTWKLWVFDSTSNTWTSIWQHEFIDALSWSPDGLWIAFRQQDSSGGMDIMVIHPDGSDPKDLTAGGNLAAVSRPYIIDGWLNDSLIVRTGKYGADDTVYVVSTTDMHVQPMFDKPLTKAMLVPSHDSAFLAYDDYDLSTDKHSLRIAAPDGTGVVELASFTGGSIFPIVWSPDGSQLAFAYSTELTQGNPAATVYVIDRNGKGLKHVYQGSMVTTIMYSSDGKYIVVNENSSATGARLFAINLDTLTQRIIQSPGLNLNADWFMASWRK